MKKLLITLVILLTLPCLLGFDYSVMLELEEGDPLLAQVAELWRYPELRAEIIAEAEAKIIETKIAEWEARGESFEVAVDITAVLIYNEGWCGTSLRHKELDGAVVYNRANSPDFPDTVYEIVIQKDQYCPAYADPDSVYSRDARADPEIWEECRRIARKALLGEVECPENVVFQAEFPQGSGTYEIHQTPYSTTWFCYA